MEPTSRRFQNVVLLPAIVALTAIAAGAQGSDNAAIVQFQRSVDSYAFIHRASDRRRVPPPLAVEGAFFTPQSSAAFRNRIKTVLRQAGCEAPAGAGFEVPRVNASARATADLPSCIAQVLPALPPELEYRTAGVALVLADAELHVAIDVLHAAFP